MKEVLKTIIRDFHTRDLPSFYERQQSIPLNTKKVITLIGPRRAGKTYHMYQLIAKIKDKTNSIYINFEDERIKPDASNLNLILEAFFELYPDKKGETLYFFFDEIEGIEGWEKFVRRLYDTISQNIFITGSSSKLLKKEIATSLRGRTISFEIFPLSFQEYIHFKNREADYYTTKGKAKILSEFDSYLLKGAYPEVITMDPEIYEKTLQSYFEVMLYRDIIERNKLRNTDSLKWFIQKLITNVSKEFSIHKIFNEYKSQGRKISKDFLYKYMDYCEDAYLLFSVHNFSESFSKQTSKKVYAIDTGLHALFSLTLSQDKGRLFENSVFLELRRKNKEIYFFKGAYECDFIIKEKDKITECIQACYEYNEENKEREIQGLKEAMKRFHLKQGILLTLDREQDLGEIQVIPIYKWLLQKEKLS